MIGYAPVGDVLYDAAGRAGDDCRGQASGLSVDEGALNARMLVGVLSSAIMIVTISWCSTMPSLPAVRSGARVAASVLLASNRGAPRHKSWRRLIDVNDVRAALRWIQGLTVQGRPCVTSRSHSGGCSPC